MTEIILKILAGIIPAILLMLIPILTAKRPRPIGSILVTFILGVLIVPELYFLFYLGWPNIPTEDFTDAYLSSFISAAIPEEGLKFLTLYVLAKWFKLFDKVYYGIIFAVCISMGLSGSESILYMFEAEEELFFEFTSRIWATSMHYFVAVVMGTYFSLGWYDKTNRKLYLGYALVIPILLHGIYDIVCFELEDSLRLDLLLLFVAGFIYTWRYARSLRKIMLKLNGYMSGSHIINCSPIHIPEISVRICHVFDKEGYTTNLETLTRKGADISITNDELFPKLDDRETAMKISLRPQENVILFDVSIGIHDLQRLPSDFISKKWLIHITEVWGIMHRHRLEDKVLVTACVGAH